MTRGWTPRLPFPPSGAPGVVAPSPFFADTFDGLVFRDQSPELVQVGPTPAFTVLNMPIPAGNDLLITYEGIFAALDDAGQGVTQKLMGTAYRNGAGVLIFAPATAGVALAPSAGSGAPPAVFVDVSQSGPDTLTINANVLTAGTVSMRCAAAWAVFQTAIPPIP